MKHLKAFEIYYGLGEGRSYEKVAAQLNMSMTSVGKWGKLFGWRERIAERDSSKAKKMQDDNDKAFMDDVKQYRLIVKASIKDYLTSLKNGKIEIKKVDDIVKLIELDLKLMNVRFDDNKDTAVKDNMNDTEKETEKQLWASLDALEIDDSELMDYMDGEDETNGGS